LKKIRVALIGYGRSGRNIHRKLLLQLPDKYEFVAECDLEILTVSFDVAKDMPLRQDTTWHPMICPS